MNTKPLRLRFNREKQETGLAGIGQGPRGYYIKANLPGNIVDNVASIYALRNGWKFEYLGWKWQVFSCEQIGLKRVACKKTYPLTDEGLEQAKADCMSYIKEVIEKFER